MLFPPLSLLVLALAGALAAGGRPTAPPQGRGYYAAPAPTGSPGGDGSARRPWDLATALGGGRARVQPGDTVWLLGGTYRGVFRSTVQGRDGAPVVIRQFPGARAVIDGAGSTRSTLHVAGAHSIFWGFELTNSDPRRSTSAKARLRPDVVVNYASHTKYINLVIHDGGVGFYTEPEFVDVEVTGCILYNNGWQGPDRGHGHGIYLKSFTGPVVARDNVVFNQYGYGVHAYSNAGTGKLVNIRIEGNVAFNNGTLASRASLSPNILLGGLAYATGGVIRDNLTYYSPALERAGANVMVGWQTLRNGDVAVEENYFVGGSPVLDIGYWSATRVTGNTLIGTRRGSLVARRDPNVRAQIWRENTERQPPSGAATIVVRPNPYEAGRAHVVVFNWDRDARVRVDVSGFLAAGDRYEVRNVQHLTGEPVASGTVAGGVISIPLEGVPPPPPVGLAASPAPRTGPAFDVFLVTRLRVDR